ncbi:hypothetical protein NBRC116188_19630 [Oceaniserpentilla sp. 4NH20-0058]
MGLIHMNGRIYDPTLARFVQADPFIDGVTNTQGYARYTYLKNNPLNATDPSGFFLDKLGDSIEQFGNWLSHDPVAQAIITIAVCATPGVNAVGCASFAAGMTTTTTYIATGDSSQAFKAGALSAMSSFAFAQIGDVFSAASGMQGSWQHVLAHATTGGVMSVLQGGKFGHGFVSAGVAKGLNVNRIMTGEVDFAARFTRISLAALIGGTTSELTGGKFGNGAITAAMAQAMNGEKAQDEIAKKLINPTGGEIRNDSEGDGSWKASRGSREHLALDLSAENEQLIISPVDGKVTYFEGASTGYPIVDIVPSDNSLGIDKIRMLYLEAPAGFTNWSSTNVKSGQTIGSLTNINELVNFETGKVYSSGVTPHVHIQVYREGRLVNPTPYFFNGK